MDIMLVILLLLGLSMGSFVNALVWRLREGRNWWSERSECTACHHTLAWYDLIPVVSWVMLRRRCRYCHKPISAQYPLVESIVAVLFVLSYVIWPFALVTPYEWLYFGLFLAALVTMVALSVYDIRWYELPELLTASLAIVGLAMMAIRQCGLNSCTADSLGVDMALALLPIAGLYGVLHAVSRGRWVGLGDVKLGIGLGFILGWPAALVAVFLANAIGLLYVAPLMAMGKVTPKSHIPFGPFLIVAGYISFFVGQPVIEAYLRFIGIV